MPYYPFGQDDIIRNSIKAHPNVSFYIYGGVVYYNDTPFQPGDLTSDGVPHIPPGFISLYEYNVDRPDGGLIYPFLTKGGSLTSFKTITTESFNSDFQYGDIVTGSYPLSASITRNFFSSSTQSRKELDALKNTMNYYTINSEHYAYSSTNNGSSWDKDTQKVNLISIPSIFYGSQIKKGSLELNFYVSGTIIGTIKDERRNGELIQTGPVGSGGSGSIAGVALYNEGFLMLTGSWDLTNGQHTEAYNPSDSDTTPNWLKFAVGAQDGIAISSQKSAWTLGFRGTSKTQVITMFANAPKGLINHSNNPTFLSFSDSKQASSGTNFYIEPPSVSIKNIVSSSYSDEAPNFNKETYISKIGIYDENKNLIAIAKVATPVRKTEQRDLTFKLKLDI